MLIIKKYYLKEIQDGSEKDEKAGGKNKVLLNKICGPLFSNRYSIVHKGFFQKKEEVVFAYLFGSTAKGLDNNLSDVDVAVYLEQSKIPERGSFGYKSELIFDQG